MTSATLYREFEGWKNDHGTLYWDFGWTKNDEKVIIPCWLHRDFGWSENIPLYQEFGQSKNYERNDAWYVIARIWMIKNRLKMTSVSYFISIIWMINKNGVRFVISRIWIIKKIIKKKHPVHYIENSENRKMMKKWRLVRYIENLDDQKMIKKWRQVHYNEN